MTKHDEIERKPTAFAYETKRPRHTRRHRLLRFLRIAGITLLMLIAVIVGLVAAITCYLSPERLTSIVNQRASEYLDADVKATGIRFTIWSTFPHFYLEADSLRVISRHLKNASPEIRAQLPANADSLLSTAGIRGSVNIMSLLSGKVKMHDVSVDSLRFNVVAFNDSINNYDIFPPSGTKTKIPEISAHQVALTHPQPLTYYSAATKTSVRADISKVLLTALKEKNRYVLDISGKVNARYDNLDILDNFPFFLKGDISVGFSPLRARLENYTVNLGDTKGKLNLDLDLGDDMSVNSFHYDISSIDIFKLMRYLPPLALPYLDNISADLPLEMSARLTSPYHFSSTTLPSLEIDFNVPDGNMSYVFDKNQKYSIDRINCRGRFFFNGKNPDASSIFIDNLSMSGYGTSLRLRSEISDLLATPRINVFLDCNASFAKMASSLPVFRGMDISGGAHLRAHASCHISGFKNMQASDLKVYAAADFNDFAFRYPSTGLTLKAGKGSVTLNAASPVISESALLHAPVTAKGEFSNLAFHIPDADASARGITVNARANSRGDARIHCSALLSEADFTTNGIKGRLSGTAIDISLDNNTNYIPKKYETALGDSACLTRIPHTPALLAVQTPESIRNFLKNYNFSCRMQAYKANITDDADSPLLDITGMDMALTPDQFTLYPTRIDALTTGMNVTARVSGLRDLLVTGQPTPIDADINLLLGVIDINHIAHILEERGINFDKEKGATGSNANAAVPDDTISCLIPRNINAHIHASAEETIYTNLHLYHLNTDLLVEDGAAHVNNMTIESDFGHARLNALYDTSDIESLSARIGLALEQIDVVTFFKRFHTLLLMMPEMANLSGFVSAECQANAKIFPNMYLNIPSAKADIGVQGTSLKVHQSPFIHKIVKMLLIRTDKDLDIADMSVRATVHDNLLELFPFTFKCDRYTLQMQGLNNFNGDLYYHIGVDKSPIPFPFGVNITGTYRHPQLHFGGSHFKPRQAEKITADVSQDFRVNIPKELRWFISEFMHKAAQSYLTGEGL